jgi:hypothetical protein
MKLSIRSMQSRPSKKSGSPLGNRQQKKLLSVYRESFCLAKGLEKRIFGTAMCCCVQVMIANGPALL